MMMRSRNLRVLAHLVWATSLVPGYAAEPASRVGLAGHMPAVVSQLQAVGELPASASLELAIGLPLRNQTELGVLLEELQDPRSTNYHRYLTPAQFTDRFGPTASQYEAVANFARSNGLRIVGRHSNRVVLDVAGNVSSIERAFQIKLKVFRHPTEARDFFAPDREPSVPAGLPVQDMWGLSDYSRPAPLLRLAPTTAIPLNYNGSGPGGSYQGSDFRKAYAAGSTLTGSGQTVAVVEFDGYYANDIAAYERNCGYTNVPLQNVLVDNVSGVPGYSGTADAVAEVSLDIEMVIAMAPGLSKVMVYEGSNPYNVLNRIATDNLARQVSCSWAWSVGPTRSWGHPGSKTLDSQLKQMAAQGQSFFQASGDNDAYTGTQAITSSSGPIPVDSIYVTSVGGTTLTMSGTGESWASETVWNWGGNTGSGGGISPNYPIPSWQANVSMADNGGSTVYRNLPDVALTADAIYVVYNNGSTSTFGGTSCAAPLWAGFTALVNQQNTAAGQPVVGFLNPALYAIGTSTNSAACFHDTSTGNNIGSNTPGLFYAGSGFDLCTGWGTPNGTNLINALAPYPFIVTPPASRAVAEGGTVTFEVSAGGRPPFTYEWLKDGMPLPAGGNIVGVNSNVLTIGPVALADAGEYNVVASNALGAVISSGATLTVVFPPVVITQPTNQSVLPGGNAVFSATVSGATPLFFQWQQNGTNLLDGAQVAGANTDSLTITDVGISNAGDYRLLVTNTYGLATSAVATLTVIQAPAITLTPTNQTIQCGSSASFAVEASGTPPLGYQWTLDGLAIAGATGTSLVLPSVHLPDHAVEVLITNAYGGASSSATLVVEDTLGPVITLNGSNPIYVELGTPFTDPGATAEDLCDGTVPAVASTPLKTDLCSTNSILYTATDGQGNTTTAARTVIVRDTTPPAILWISTNLTLAADSNCLASMPDVTGTNYILATDLSGALVFSQNPEVNSELPVGTNSVLITVTDASGNAAWTTNEIVVLDETPPVILVQPQSQTNSIGANVSFELGAKACTALSFQWFFNSAVLPDQTNSTLTLSSLTPAAGGEYFAVVTAAGGSSTSAVAVLTVELRTATLALISSLNPSGLNDRASFTAFVTPAEATGTVQFFTNGGAFEEMTLVAGQAVTTPTAALPRGTNIISAIYSGDGTNLSCTGTLTQVVTNHPPGAADVFYTRAPGAVLEIAVTNLAASWTDPDGDIVSLADVGVSTNGVALTNDAGTIVYFSSNNVPDQFVCTITDGWEGTNWQTVTISIVPPSIAGVLANPDGSLTLNLEGAPGSTCVVEATPTLSPADWAPLATVTLDTNGTGQFTDPEATTIQQRFYRLQQGP